MSNTLGTLAIAFLILSLITLGWFGVVFLSYLLLSLLLGQPVNGAVALLLFAAFMLLRAFFPRNIFAG